MKTLLTLPPLRKLAALAGSQAALTRLFNETFPEHQVSTQAMHKWARTRIPADRVLMLESLFPGQVSRYEMRPDVFIAPPGHIDALTEEAA